MKTRQALRLAATAAALLAAAGSACAQATVTHDRALAGNITPGDSAGYPITIGQPGSYKLMSNLYVPDGLSGIQITADDVTLDLNGFKIVGAGSCVRDAASHMVTCTNANDSSGVEVKGGDTLSVVVRNGTVQGFDRGVLIKSGVVDGLTVKHNSTGVLVQGSSMNTTRISGVNAFMNGTGVRLYDYALIERCVANANSTGFGSYMGSIPGAVIDSVASLNNIGIHGLALRGSRIYLNKTNELGAVAF